MNHVVKIYTPNSVVHKHACNKYLQSWLAITFANFNRTGIPYPSVFRSLRIESSLSNARRVRIFCFVPSLQLTAYWYTRDSQDERLLLHGDSTVAPSRVCAGTTQDWSRIRDILSPLHGRSVLLRRGWNVLYSDYIRRSIEPIVGCQRLCINESRERSPSIHQLRQCELQSSTESRPTLRVLCPLHVRVDLRQSWLIALALQSHHEPASEAFRRALGPK